MMATVGIRAQDELAGKAGALLVRLGLVLLMVALPLASIYSRRLLFSMMPVGASLILIGALLMPGRRLLGDMRDALFSIPGFALLFLLVWSGLSLVWTPFPVTAGERFAKTAGTVFLVFLVLVFLPRRSRTSNLNLMPVGAGLAALAAIALYLGVEGKYLTFVDTEETTLERAAVGLVLLVWPALAALALRERWTSAGLLAVLVTVAAIMVWTPAALAGMAAGALVFSLGTSRPRLLGIAIGSVFALLFLLAPLLPYAMKIVTPYISSTPIPVTKALNAWIEVVGADHVRLLTGHGFDTMGRALVTGYLPAEVPRTILFEIWFELGLFGAILMAGLVMAAAVGAGRVDAAGAPFTLAGVTAILVIAVWGLATLHLWWVTLLGVFVIGFGSALKGFSRSARPAAKAPPAPGAAQAPPATAPVQAPQAPQVPQAPQAQKVPQAPQAPKAPQAAVTAAPAAAGAFPPPPGPPVPPAPVPQPPQTRPPEHGLPKEGSTGQHAPQPAAPPAPAAPTAPAAPQPQRPRFEPPKITVPNIGAARSNAPKIEAPPIRPPSAHDTPATGQSRPPAPAAPPKPPKPEQDS